MKTFIQCDLQSKNKKQTAWVPDDRGVKVGYSITLDSSDDPTELWQVVKMYNHTDQKQLDKQRTWNNNI